MYMIKLSAVSIFSPLIYVYYVIALDACGIVNICTGLWQSVCVLGHTVTLGS